MKISRRLCILFAVFMPQIAFSFEDRLDLNAQLDGFLNTHAQLLAEKGYRSEVSVGNIDPRMGVYSCITPIEFSFNRAPILQKHVTVKAECQDTKPWKIHLSINFEIYASSVIAATPIPRGQVIGEAQLDEKELIINQGQHSGYSHKKDLLGKVAKRSIRAGAIIQASFVKAPQLVKKGDNVVIIASNDFISVKMNGTALTDGLLGQQISIQNNQSKRIIKGKVLRTGVVTITL